MRKKRIQRTYLLIVRLILHTDAIDPVSPLVAHINRMVKVLKHFVTDERMENINTVILAISYLIDLDLDDGTFVTSI